MKILEKLGYGPVYDATAPEALRLSPTRLVLAALMALALAPSLSWAAAAAWLGVLAGLEFWIRNLLARQVRKQTLAVRIERIVASTAASAAWVSAGVLLWFAGDPAMRAAAVALWAGTLLYAQSSCSKVPGHFILVGGPPLLALGTAPFLTPDVPAGLQFTLAGCVGVCILHTLNSTAANLRFHRELQGATAELMRQREAAEAANQAKTNFLAMMSHELRTPMNGVLGLAHALQRTGLDAKQKDLLDGIARSGDALLGILNDILDLAKIEAGRMEVRLEPSDVHQILSQARELFSETAAAKGIDLRLEIDASTPRWADLDALRLRQILLNLVSNALKFTQAGHVTLSARALEGDAEGRCSVAICVEDTGPGLAEEVLANLFRPFFQGGAGIARSHGGTGLGLAISRELAGAMGGRLDARNRPEGGAAFELILPLQVRDSPAPAQPAEAAPDEETAPRELSILVAEDNAMNRAVVRALLEPTGWPLTFAENGVLALEALRARVFDLVLMDVHMPLMDGMAAVAAIRSGAAGDPSVPVIALTADAMSGDRQRFLAVGFDAHVAKPIRPAELLSVINQVLNDAAGEGTEAPALTAGTAA